MPGIALTAFLLVLAATWIDPPYPAEQALHHSLTAVGLLALVAVHRRRPLPAGSLVLVLVFLTLHTIAARWIYSFVPYDDWSQWLTGHRLSEVFGWQRNHFDRLVHLSYGVCGGAVLFRYLREARGWRRGWAAFAAVDAVLSTSAVYELFEWGVAMTLGAGAAEAYNGQQGDVWDAHKDMALAAAGALLAVLLGAVRGATPGGQEAPGGRGAPVAAGRA